MTDMQLVDSALSYLPQVNPINLEDFQKIPGGYNLENMVMPLYIALTIVLFGILIALGWRVDKKMAEEVSGLEEHMYLIGGDVTEEVRKKAEMKIQAANTWKKKCYIYWKCWTCDKVRHCRHRHNCAHGLSSRDCVACIPCSRGHTHSQRYKQSIMRRINAPHIHYSPA